MNMNVCVCVCMCGELVEALLISFLLASLTDLADVGLLHLVVLCKHDLAARIHRHGRLVTTQLCVHKNESE